MAIRRRPLARPARFLLRRPLLLLLLLCAACGHCGAAKKHGAVRKLTDADQDLLQEGEWLVKFFADWCNACEMFGPVYEEAAADLAKEFPDLKIAAVNVDEETELAARFQVNVLPTVYHISHGEIWSPAYDWLSAESLVRAVREVKKTGQKWTGYLHPFGGLATALALLGRLSGQLSRFWRTLPWWSFWVVVAVLMGLTVWAVFLEDESQRAALLEDRRGEGEAKEVDGGSAAAGGIQANATARRRKKGEQR